MTQLNDSFGLPKGQILEIREYSKTIEDWCNEMNVSEELKASVLNAQLVLIPAGFENCPTAFSYYATDFYVYCKQINDLTVEICCEEENFTQLELCSFKVRLGKLISPATISGVILWNVISGYIKDVIDANMTNGSPEESVTDKPAFQSEPECSFSVVVRDSTGKYIEVNYDGPVFGMEEAGNQIKKITGDEQ